MSLQDIIGDHPLSTFRRDSRLAFIDAGILASSFK
jgi:hypothetical protein